MGPYREASLDGSRVAIQGISHDILSFGFIPLCVMLRTADGIQDLTSCASESNAWTQLRYNTHTSHSQSHETSSRGSNPRSRNPGRRLLCDPYSLLPTRHQHHHLLSSPNPQPPASNNNNNNNNEETHAKPWHQITNSCSRWASTRRGSPVSRRAFPCLSS